MTHIDFYHDVPDKLALASRLIGDCWRAGQKVVVFAPDRRVAEQIDRILWVQPALSFVPHCPAGSKLAAETPILIAQDLENGLPAGHDQVLVNLNGELPLTFSRFERLVEIVSRDDDDKNQARQRFRFYKDRGYPIESHAYQTLEKS